MRYFYFLSTQADRLDVDISFTVCVFVFYTVTDFSAEDKASGVKFCMAVYRRPGQEISHFCELCSPRSPKSDKSASSPPLPRRSQRLPFGCRTHASVDVGSSPKMGVFVICFGRFFASYLWS